MINTRKTAAVILTVLQIQMLMESEPVEIFVPNFLTFFNFWACTLQKKSFCGGH